MYASLYCRDTYAWERQGRTHLDITHSGRLCVVIGTTERICSSLFSLSVEQVEVEQYPCDECEYHVKYFI